MYKRQLQVLTGCKVEAALVEEAKKYDAEGEGRMAHTAPGFQFMRVGYFCKMCIRDSLFMSVAQSMVIFGPIFQLGWRRASALVTDASSSRLFPKNGPPEQVRICLLYTSSQTGC